MKPRHFFIAIFVGVALSVLALTLLVTSESGSRWLIAKTLNAIPGQVTFQQSSGRLSDQIHIQDFSYQSGEGHIEFQQLDFSWKPAQLIQKKLHIAGLQLHGLRVDWPETAAKDDSPFEWDSIKLPIMLTIENVALTDARIKIGASEHAIQSLRLGLQTDRDHITLHELSVEALPFKARLMGNARLAKNLPLDLSANWQIETDKNGHWQGNSKLTGDLQQLSIDTQTVKPYQLSLTGHIYDVARQPSFDLKAAWPSLQWPLAAKPVEIISERGTLALTGTPDNYQISLNSQLKRDKLPVTRLGFSGRGNLKSLQIQQLDLTSKQGNLSINGPFAWEPRLSFNLAVNGKDFNPALLNPLLPGNVNINTQISGDFSQAQTVNVSIQKLSGQLRNQPLTGSGQLKLRDQQLLADRLSISVGNNHLNVNGMADESRADLNLDLSATRLAELWPGLSGAIQAKGELKGEWQKPVIHLNAQGRNIRYNGHQLAQFNLTAINQPDKPDKSRWLLQTKDVRSGDLRISQLNLEAIGTIEKQGVTLSMASHQVDVNTTFSGRYSNQRWQGMLETLQINQAHAGLWQLQKATPIDIKPVNNAVDAKVGLLCLQQKSASLCAQGDYYANGDFNLQTQVVQIPTQLANPYLPSHLKQEGFVDGKSALSQQKNRLTGDYQFQLSPLHITLLHQTNTSELTLGGAEIVGQIRENRIHSNAHITLMNNDSLHAQIQGDMRTRQITTAHLQTDIREWGWLAQAFPQLPAIKGHLLTDLTAKGLFQQAQITGNASLKDGWILLPDSDISLNDIQITAEAEKNNILIVNGSVKPEAAKNSKLAELISLQKPVNVSVRLQALKSGVNGDYQISLPAQAFTLKQPPALTLGEIKLSGHVNGLKHELALQAQLIKQDRIDAQLAVNTGTSQALNGQVKASVAQLSVFNPLLPQVSHLKGQLSADLSIAGHINQPDVSGTLELKNAGMTINEPGISLENLKLKALAPGNITPIQLSGSTRSGSGSVHLSGLIDLRQQAEKRIDLKLKGQDFEALKIPQAQVMVSPDLQFTLQDNQSVLSGKLTIPKARIELQEIPEDAVTVSQDEVIMGVQRETKKTAGKRIDMNAAITVELDKDVQFSGQGLKADLTGKLKILKNPEKMTVRGEIGMDKARYKSYGQDLTVRKGRFIFNGPADNPWLDVEAIRFSKDQKVTAILAVTGQLDAPDTKISSEPALPETEALAYLVTGHSLSRASKSENDMLAGAALAYGASQASWLVNQLGIDEFDVEQGETLQDSLVSVGPYLTPSFYLGTKVGMFNKQVTVILKYLISDSFNVETQTGANKRIKLNYEYDKD